MKLYFLFAVCLLCFYACSNKKDVELIGKNKMMDLITEVSLADAYAETYVLRDSSLKKDSVLQQELNAVYKINNITPEQFALSYKYYSSNPILFKEIIDSAHARAYRKKDKIYLSTNVK
jgi:hypothetical protein